MKYYLIDNLGRIVGLYNDKPGQGGKNVEYGNNIPDGRYIIGIAELRRPCDVRRMYNDDYALADLTDSLTLYN